MLTRLDPSSVSAGPRGHSLTSPPANSGRRRRWMLMSSGATDGTITKAHPSGLSPCSPLIRKSGADASHHGAGLHLDNCQQTCWGCLLFLNSRNKWERNLRTPRRLLGLVFLPRDGYAAIASMDSCLWADVWVPGSAVQSGLCR